MTSGGDAIKIHSDQIESFANTAMKAPALVAAGGVVAALGFYSANYARLASSPDLLMGLNETLYWLMASLLATVLAPGLAYLSQIAYAASVSKERLDFNYPYVHNTWKSKTYLYIGDFFRLLTVLVVVISIVMLALGGWKFLLLVR